ncbi:MAG: lysophospholipid acyltransferase family protein [Thermodesulfobacteriota bacterium]
MLRACYSWASIVLFTIIFGIPATVLSFIAPDRVLKYFVKPWSSLILRACNIKVQLEGLENLPKEPCLIMFNHQSYFDIFAFAATLPFDWRVVMKKELALVPFIGWVSKATGHYFVSRDGSIKSFQEVDKVAKRIRFGPPVLIAPEGTRSIDGKLLSFKRGGFVLAMRAEVPVVPMVILGGKDVMPKGSMRIKPGNMKIKILPVIDVKSLPSGKLGRDELLSLVKEALEKALIEGERS